MIQALIFDFDGVLISSELPRFAAIQSIAAKHDVTIADSAIKVASGKTTLNFLKEVLSEEKQKLIEPLMEEFRKTYVANITQYVQPITFTVNFIRNYQGPLPIAIASMSSQATIESMLKHLGIFDKVTKIITRDEVMHHKPHPEIYLKTASELHLQPYDCFVFEDTPLGVTAATKAGMKCCVVLNGLNTRTAFEALNVFAYVDSEKDMHEAIRRFDQSA